MTSIASADFLLRYSKEEQENCVELGWLVFWAQLIAIGLIAGALWRVGELLANMDLLLLAITSAALLFLHCWSDFLRNGVRRLIAFVKQTAAVRIVVPPSERHARLINDIRRVVIADTIILLFLIRATGGFGESPLDPLLPTIPIIAIILRQPKRTIYIGLLLQLVVILIVGLHGLIHTFALGDHCWHWLFEFLRPPPLSDSRAYHRLAAFCVVAAGSIALSVIEYLETHRRSALLSRLQETLVSAEKLMPGAEEFATPIQKGIERWVVWLDGQGLAAEDVSKVHESEDLVYQSIILSGPHRATERDAKLGDEITRHITTMVHAAHWLDDQFDPLSTLARDSAREEEVKRFQEITPDELLHRDFRLRNLLELIYKCQATITARPDIVRRAFARIIYGGLIQNALTQTTLDARLDQYVSYVSGGLSARWQEAYNQARQVAGPLFPCVTCKVVFELFDSAARVFSLDESEFFNFFYSPLLFHQNFERELVNERFGDAFGSPQDTRAKFPKPEQFAAILRQVCQPLMKDVLGWNSLPTERELQLRYALSVYGGRGRLPEVVEAAYQEFLSSSPARLVSLGITKRPFG
jgi:hypothetical protein